MEALLYLALASLALLAARAFAPPSGGNAAELPPRDVPREVRQAAMRKSPGIHIRRVGVEMDGTHSVRYRVSGFLPDGQSLSMMVHADGEALALDARGNLLEAPREVLSGIEACVPALRLLPGTIRRMHGRACVWYEAVGVLPGGDPVALKVSPDGRDMLLCRLPRQGSNRPDGEAAGTIITPFQGKP
ncbi:hypothetical protein NNJEOMEG_04016 [Fundidesulfovibrio magnetotacticus]|uniref:PepSY domain-containing protein n=1 Tax=Fundidesulfovibrio magnetotacticus TaxID=2730080 RepID=A0A6V8M2I7_9BACT|nr:hypothetical protein [Fundidesulfovibrio magnetotacticus]GFK96136.1 hypothetical protein NNJEOMEG_04016 [Fundidesulfovibrio magnetotacticus]